MSNEAIEALAEIISGYDEDGALMDTWAHEVAAKLKERGFTIAPIAPSDEKVRAAIKELNMAAGIADTFHGRNCCAALDVVEAALAERDALRAELAYLTKALEVQTEIAAEKHARMVRLENLYNAPAELPPQEKETTK